MAILSVSANRMNMMSLKRRLVIARKGHELLKRKQEELMRNFLELVGQIKGLRQRTEEILVEALREFTLHMGSLSRQELEAIFIVPAVKANLIVSRKKILNLRVPHFEVEFSGNPVSYSLVFTPAYLDAVMRKLTEVLKLLLQLAEVEKKMQLLANEIDTTRRRVNALEYIMIPDLTETIRYIRMKLEELDRGNLTRLMKVKDMLEEKRVREFEQEVRLR